MRRLARVGAAWTAVAVLGWAGLGSEAARVSDIRATRHNLSAAAAGASTPTGTVPSRTVSASTETQVCVFCHTPHGASTQDEGGTALKAPLWNRRVPAGSTYTMYTSSSLDSQYITDGLSSQPGGSSKLCLSCHDGTLAIGSVNVLNGAANATITMSGTGTDGVMPSGSGTTTGFTRFLGTDLGNDHPISVTYDDALATRDGELRALDTSQRYPAGTGTVVGVRSSGYKPLLPLEATGAKSGASGQVQCATCHDPHIRETAEATVGNQKFLRTNRFQEAQPTGSFSQANDIICLGCHDKGGQSWAYSAHAQQNVADETYGVTAANTREFPSGLPVWKASCLNCHDTHTVQGARRLLREGTDNTSTPKQGGNSALEETCYQCHDGSTNVLASVSLGTNNSVPNIKGDFALTIRMPLTSSAQGNGTTEVHDVGGNFNDTGFVNCSGSANRCGADLIEPQSVLAQRHAECTDCHNPHRVIKYQNGLPGDLSTLTFPNNPSASTGNAYKSGTHRHENTSGYIHTNIISGVLRGSWGVEPTYPNNSFHSMPSGFGVKRGDPGTSSANTVGSSWVTREYQICLKCHSNYGYADDNTYPNSSARPQLGGTGGTAQNANGHANFTSFTNQAKEFQAPGTHAVATGSVNLGCDAGAGPETSCTTNTNRNNNNHRSWHPVMAATGRTNRPGAFLSPWNNSTDANNVAGTAGRLGVQTMYCSDCHGSATGTATVMPSGNSNTSENGSPWGPHGSTNNFLLKGTWSTSSGEGDSNTLCFKCHNQTNYTSRDTGGTGFNTDKGDGHMVHSDRIDNPMKCNFCHVAVPHGWKNRSLLVNLLDVGPEAGLARNTAVSYTNNVGYTNGPYYRQAFLRIISFPAAGNQWTEANCNGGSKSTMKTNCEQPN